MRKVILTSVVLVIVWCGWWWAGAAILTRALTAGGTAERSDGWQSELSRGNVSGFPAAFEVDLSDVLLRHPQRGVELRADAMNLHLAAYWPGHASAVLPASPIVLRGPKGVIYFRAPKARVDLRLRPGPALELQQVRVRGTTWQVDRPQGNLLIGRDFLADVQQDEADAQTYNIELQGDDLRPGDVIRQAAQMAEDWPETFDRLEGHIRVTLDRALDRHSARSAPPRLKRLGLHALDAVWGPVALTGTGDIAIDAQGVPEGTLSVRVQNWREVLAVVRRGDTGVSVPPQAEIMLNALANMGGDPDTLELIVSFRDASLFLGPIRLGPAPRLALP